MRMVPLYRFRMRALILGGTGFIGFEVCRTLLRRGHDVVVLARRPGPAFNRLAGVTWLQRDLRSMQAPADWAVLSGFDAVVNCAGALQDGAGDDVGAVQEGAMLALYHAAPAAGIRLIVQVSARTDGPGAGSAFLASKRTADAALKQSKIPFVILRPAVVIGRNAHGGSALLRALAAVPWRTPLIHPDTPVQFVALDDVAGAVADALEGRIPAGSDLALTATEILPLREAVALHRAWLGLPPAQTVAVPAGMARPVGAIADLLGWLGWRSPFRSTAMDIAAGGIAASALPDSPVDRPRASLAETLAANPAGVQDLWFARLYLLKPLVIGTLALFWLLSGTIALLRFQQSSGFLAAGIGSPSAAGVLTVLTSFADILLGAAVLSRRYARPALIGMILLSLGYLGAATVVAPGLWVDPLGPLLKVLPAVVLVFVALAILDER